jgi:hypothetical protein
MCRVVLTRRPRATAAASVAAALVVLASSACGRKATAEDCDLIVDRYVEVELSALKVTDPAVITQRKAEMRRDLKDDLKACPGKRITDSMIACVRGAQSNGELDKCTRW